MAVFSCATRVFALTDTSPRPPSTVPPCATKCPLTYIDLSSLACVLRWLGVWRHDVLLVLCGVVDGGEGKAVVLPRIWARG